MKDSILIVGLDGASWKVLDPLIKSGCTPFLAQLKNNSSHGVLSSTIPPLTAPSWVSFQTGKNPGEHGVFGFLNYRTNPSSPSLVDSRSIKAPRIWDEFSEKNIKSLIINMPVSYPITPTNGIIISSFLTPPGKPFVYPHKYQKLLRKIKYEIDLLEGKSYGTLPQGKLSKAQKKKLLTSLISIARRRVEAYKVLSKEDNFSFNFLLFKETDLAQHLFWGTKTLNYFYSELDSLIASLYGEYGGGEKGKNFIILSDHGFHPAAKLQFSPYSWLRKNGFLTEAKNYRILTWNCLSKINNILARLGIKAANLESIRKLRRELLIQEQKSESAESAILPTPQGLYFTGTKTMRKDLARTITKELRRLSYKQKKVFQLVETPEAIYHGRYVNRAPDIVWMTNENFAIDVSPFSKSIFTKRTATLLGDHTSDPEGIFIFNTNKYKKGKRKKMEITQVKQIIDEIVLDHPSSRQTVLDKDQVHKIISKEISKII